MPELGFKGHTGFYRETSGREISLQKEGTLHGEPWKNKHDNLF